MAKQKGIIKLEGTIGDITFYKSQDGFLAKGKGGIPAVRIVNDQNFQRTRVNGSEFGRAGKAGKTLRTAFRAMLHTPVKLPPSYRRKLTNCFADEGGSVSTGFRWSISPDFAL